MSVAIRTVSTPKGVVAIARGTLDGQRVERYAFQPYAGVEGAEVGAFGDRIKSIAQKAAKSKVVRGLAKATGKVLRALPYTSTAMTVIDTARGIARGARGGSSSSRSSSSSRRSSASSRGRQRGAQAQHARLRRTPAGGDLELARRMLWAPGMNDRAKVSALKVILGAERRPRRVRR